MSGRNHVLYSVLFRGLIALTILAGLLASFPVTPAQAYTGGYALNFIAADGDVVRINYGSGPTGGSVRAIFGTNWRATKSMSVWVRPLGASIGCWPVTGTNPTVCDPIIASESKWFGISRGIYNGEDRIWAWNSDDDGNGQPSLDWVGVPYTVGEWVHITYVHDSGTLSIFKNGVLSGSVASGPTGPATSPENINLALGGSITGGAQPKFSGQIDEVGFWRVPLTEAIVRPWMNREIDSTHPNWSDLYAYYKMSNGSGTTLTDDRGNGFNGIFIATPEWVTSGSLAGPRKALDFDGTNDYVQMPASLTMPGNLTLEAWVYPRDVSAGQKWIAGEVGGARLTMDGTTLQFYIHDGTSQQGPATATLAANQWQHVAGTYDGTTLKVYVNGVRGTDVSATGSNTDQAGIFAIGSPDGSTLLNNMLVDELRLWNAARTQDQIRKDMFQTLNPASEGNLIGYYRFDQQNAANQNTLFDLTASNIPGTLTNMDPASDWVDSTAFNTWVGSGSSDWATGGNWSRYSAPVSTGNVGVYSYPLSFAPVISTGAVSVSNLLASTDASLSVNSGSSLTVSGSLFNYGSLGLTQAVSGSSNVGFFDTGNYGGVLINANGDDLGATTVVIEGDQDCTTVPGDTVKRCFNINTTTNDANIDKIVTFFFGASEESGNTCASMEVYHRVGSSWVQKTRDASYGTDGRMCGSDPRSIRVYDVDTFSPFVLNQEAPTAISLVSFTGTTETGGALLIAAFLFSVALLGVLFWLRKRQSAG